MDKIAIKTIEVGLMTFKPSIVFTTTEDPKKTVQAAIDASPKIAYFLQGYSFSGSANRFELKPRYTNTDTRLSSVHVIQSMEECMRYLCCYVGDYKKQLVVVVPKTLDLHQVSKEFLEKHGPFYSNLVGISTQTRHISGAYMVYQFTFDYRIGKVKLNMMEQEVDAEVERIVKLLFLPEMPTEVKVYLVHNYLATNVVYRDKSSNSLASSFTQSAYGALIKRECVCQGYAEAFKRIMDYAGIECDVVAGQIVGSTEHHAWNIISLGPNRGYYHIDVTWDSAKERPSYVYFCKKDSFFTGKRTWNKKHNHACNCQDAVLSVARIYIRRNKNLLLSRGVELKVLDC